MISKKITLKQLETHLFKAADILRGKMDAEVRLPQSSNAQGGLIG